MSRTNVVYKIRDKDTGLFWGGDRVRCTHHIGTRFVRLDELEGRVMWITRYEGGWPDNWEVVKVELSETVLEVIDPRTIQLKRLIETEFPKILRNRGVEFHVVSGAHIFIELRAKRELRDWPFMGVLPTENRYTRAKWFHDKMLSIGVERDRYMRRGMGWLTFRDESAAVASKLVDAAGVIVQMHDVVEELAKAISTTAAEIWND